MSEAGSGLTPRALKAAEAPEQLSSEVYVRNSWGLWWPTMLAFKRFPNKKSFHLGYKEDDGRLHIVASEQIFRVTNHDERLEITIETDIASVGVLVLRVGTQLEFVQWMAALHEKWECEEPMAKPDLGAAPVPAPAGEATSRVRRMTQWVMRGGGGGA